VSDVEKNGSMNLIKPTNSSHTLLELCPPKNHALFETYDCLVFGVESPRREKRRIGFQRSKQNPDLDGLTETYFILSQRKTKKKNFEENKWKIPARKEMCRKSVENI
jgi:hypothetical protein